MKKMFLFAALMSFAAVSANAKKTTILDVDKAQIFNDCSNCEQTLTEEHGSQGHLMMKLNMPKQESWWAGLSRPGKSWDGFDFIRFKAFNPAQKPAAVTFNIKFNDFKCTWDDAFTRDLWLRSGDNDVEIEILGACTNSGTAIDWNTKMAIWCLSGAEQTPMFIGSIYLVTSENK